MEKKESSFFYIDPSCFPANSNQLLVLNLSKELISETTSTDLFTTYSKISKCLGAFRIETKNNEAGRVIN